MQAELLLPEYQATAANIDLPPATVYSAESRLTRSTLEHVCKEGELEEEEDTVHKFDEVKQESSNHATNTKLNVREWRSDIFLEGDRGAIRVDVTVVRI